MERNIVLIGMSGAGKSTLGVLLAKALGMDFLDSDIVIQRREGMKLQELLDRRGAERFLQAEEAALLSLNVHGCVVATGGSAVYSERAMAALRAGGVTVYLRVPAAELLRRVTNIRTRGIVMPHGGGFEALLAERLPLYQRFADLTVDCSGRDVEASVEEIIRRLESLPAFVPSSL